MLFIQLQILTNLSDYRNNLPTDNMLDVAKSIASEKVTSNEPLRKATYLDLLKTKVLRINMLGSCIIWFVLGISYYGSNQYIGQTSSNVFITVLLAGVLQVIFSTVFNHVVACSKTKLHYYIGLAR